VGETRWRSHPEQPGGMFENGEQQALQAAPKRRGSFELRTTAQLPG